MVFGSASSLDVIDWWVGEKGEGNLSIFSRLLVTWSRGLRLGLTNVYNSNGIHLVSSHPFDCIALHS